MSRPCAQPLLGPRRTPRGRRRSTLIWRPGLPFWSSRTRRCAGHCSAAAPSADACSSISLNSGSRNWRGRGAGRDGGSRHQRRGVHQIAPIAQTAARPSAARARRNGRTCPLPVLRVRPAFEAGRGLDRDAGGRAAPLEGGADGARTLRLPGLRDGNPTARAVLRYAARPVRTALPRAVPVREVQPASAAEPADRALCPRGRRHQPVDASRPGRCLHGGPGTAASLHRGPCARGRAPAR